MEQLNEILCQLFSLIEEEKRSVFMYSTWIYNVSVLLVLANGRRLDSGLIEKLAVLFMQFPRLS